jgi:thymidylate synthase (FAD)
MVNIIKPSYDIEPVDGLAILKKIEKAGRTCYKSEDKITEESCKTFVGNIIKSGHESVIEHEKVTVRIICDRGVTHEIVRHRIASYSQESTRYCNYAKGKFGEEITVITPKENFDNPESFDVWFGHMLASEKAYKELIELGEKPQMARSILPNSLKTEIVCTFNLREWRWFFKLRTSPKAHPQMREVTIPLLADMKKLIPVVFDDIEVDEE